MLGVPGTEGEHQRDDEHEERERDDDVDDAHDDRVEPAAPPAGDQAERRPDDEREQHGQRADAQVDAGAVEQAGADVAAELVGAQQVPVAGRLQRASVRSCSIGSQLVSSGAKIATSTISPSSASPAASSGLRRRRAAAPRAGSRAGAATSGDGGHDSSTRGSRAAWATSVSRLTATTMIAKTSVTPCTTGSRG